MKTTLDINDGLLARAKAQAARERSSLTRLIEDGLRLRLRNRRASAKNVPALAIFEGKGGLRSGLDATTNRALIDAADDDA
jgi:hypothetical protein